MRDAPKLLELFGWLARERREGEWLGDTACRLLFQEAMRDSDGNRMAAARMLFIAEGKSDDAKYHKVWRMVKRWAPEWIAQYKKREGAHNQEVGDRHRDIKTGVSSESRPQDVGNNPPPPLRIVNQRRARRGG